MRDIRKKGWFWIENSLIDRDDLNPYEKLLYMTLARYCDSDGKCFPAIETLMKATGINGKATVVKYLKNLEEKQLISVIRNSGKSNIYFLKNADKKEEDQFNSNTSSGDEPVQEMNGCSSIDEPVPVHDVNPKETNLKKHNYKNIKEKINKKETTTDKLLSYIDSLDFDENKKVLWKEWINYKKSRGQQYKNTMSIDKLLKKFNSYDVDLLEEIINKSIMNNYAGLFELNNNFTKQHKVEINNNMHKVKTKSDTWWQDL